MIGVAMALTMTAALVAGVLPALRLSRTTLRSGLAGGGRATIASGHRFQRVLVATQLALSLLLASAAGLLLRTMVNVAGVDPGLAAGYSLRAFLFGVTPNDPVALAGACLVLTIATLLAAYLPARRAAAVGPIVALRCE